jgi:amyloid beta A4 protein
MATVFVGVAVAKYRASRSPHAQGFVEVDQVKKLLVFSRKNF